MHYLAVQWIHTFPEDPVLLYSELDEARWETRKVEVYRNGRSEFADAEHETDTIGLGLEPIPTLEEIAEDSQFLVWTIDQTEFEEAWAAALRGGELPNW